MHLKQTEEVGSNAIDNKEQGCLRNTTSGAFVTDQEEFKQNRCRCSRLRIRMKIPKKRHDVSFRIAWRGTIELLAQVDMQVY